MSLRRPDEPTRVHTLLCSTSSTLCSAIRCISDNWTEIALVYIAKVAPIVALNTLAVDSRVAIMNNVPHGASVNIFSESIPLGVENSSTGVQGVVICHLGTELSDKYRELSSSIQCRGLSTDCWVNVIAVNSCGSD